MTTARVASVRILGAVGIGAVMLTTAACTSSATSAGGETVSPTPTASTPMSTPVSTPASTSDTPMPRPTTSVTSSTPPSTSAVPPTTATTTLPAPTSSAPTVSPSTCRSVGIRVIQGGAERGAEIAALQFINTGTTSCRLGGFPKVALLRHGVPVGTTSQPSTSTPKTLTLQPGDTVESLLRDFSSCQAPLSDAARVTVPGETTTAVRPIQLRACTLRVGPLGPPA